MRATQIQFRWALFAAVLLSVIVAGQVSAQSSCLTVTLHQPVVFPDGSEHAAGRLTLSGVFQQIDRGAETEQLLSVATDVRVSDSRTVRFAVTSRTDDSGADNDDIYLIAGADERLSKHLLAFIEVFFRAADTDGADESAVIAGFRFDF